MCVGGWVGTGMEQGYVCVRRRGGKVERERVGFKLQALVYDILPSTTAVFSCAIGPTKNVS